MEFKKYNFIIIFNFFVVKSWENTVLLILFIENTQYLNEILWIYVCRLECRIFLDISAVKQRKVVESWTQRVERRGEVGREDNSKD